VIGLGYVGLPLARLFATKYAVVGFDINRERIAEIESGIDSLLEIDAILQKVLVTSTSTKQGLYATSSVLDEMKDCNYYIITVPTPVDKNNRPDLTLYKARNP
jgi:UDP-N-acetyl-D-galactosamine dehydrogenase